MEINIREIENATQGNLVQYSENQIISEFLIDSRLLLFPTKTAFFAIKTEHNDGHFFIENLYRKGVRVFVISDKNFPVFEFSDAAFIWVPNVVTSLQKLAIHHRKNLKAKVIAITGSNGKTIVKEWLKQIFETRFRVSATPKSYNSQIGVPLSVCQADTTAEIAIFEAGISKPGEMRALQKIISPDIGLIINIGEAHGENFTSLREKLQEKLILFQNVQKLIFCSNQEIIREEVVDFSKKNGIELFSWGSHSSDNLYIENISEQTDHTVLKAHFDNQSFEIIVPFTNAIFIENAMHCFAAALCCGMKKKYIAQEISSLKTVSLRLDLQKGINRCAVINDSYNLDFDSLRGALDFLQHQKSYPKKTLILSDILQSDKPDELLYKKVADLIQEKEISRFIGVGTRISVQKNLFPGTSRFFDTTEQLIDNLGNIDFSDEAILLKGSRIFHFESISRVLQQHSHETILEVNLNALIHNFNYFRTKAHPAGIMAMVKAAAYGSGSEEVSNVLQYYGINYLTVAYADEGVALRNAGITVPIMVMNPENEGFSDIITHNLEPEIYNFRTLNLLEQSIRNHLFYQPGVVRFHIKLDTGMHRLGFLKEEIDALITKILSLKNCRVQSVFSHLAGSDDPEMDVFSHQQIENFNRMSQKIANALPYKILRHIDNSSAIHRFPEAHLDMVRLGIGLYGVSPQAEEQRKLMVVNSLYTSISQIKTIPAGHFIGYNNGFQTEKKTRIAVIPVGYADGLHRSLKNRGKVFINNTLCPIIGNICMDMCMVDISDVEAKEGDRVEIFGKNQSIVDFASQANTIPYEIFTCISPRVKRIYIQE